MTPEQFTRLRNGLGLTQAQAAERLGVHRVTVARWEAGMRAIPEPTARLWTRIAQDERKPQRVGRGL